MPQPARQPVIAWMQLHSGPCAGDERCRGRLDQAQVHPDALGIADPAVVLLRRREAAVRIDLAMRDARIQRGDFRQEQATRQGIERDLGRRAGTHAQQRLLPEIGEQVRRRAHQCEFRLAGLGVRTSLQSHVAYDAGLVRDHLCAIEVKRRPRQSVARATNAQAAIAMVPALHLRGAQRCVRHAYLRGGDVPTCQGRIDARA